MNTKRVKQWAAGGLIVGTFLFLEPAVRVVGAVVWIAAFGAFVVARLNE